MKQNGFAPVIWILVISVLVLTGVGTGVSLKSLNKNSSISKLDQTVKNISNTQGDASNSGRSVDPVF